MKDLPADSFVFYRSFLDATLEMDDDADKLSTLLAICKYALYDTEPDLTSPLPRAVFTVIKPNIDANKVRRAGGKSGGRPRKKPVVPEVETTGFEDENHRFSETETTGFEDENHRFFSRKPNEDVNVNEDGDIRAEKPPRSRFTPPTLAEVQSYVAERHSPVDPQGFIDFYESKGWMVGKTPMKDWKAACRNAEKWERWQHNVTEETPRRYDASTGTWS